MNGRTSPSHDSPDFHLRLAPHMKALGIPVVYLVAPQVWAWRKGRIRLIKCNRIVCCASFHLRNFFAVELAQSSAIHGTAGRLDEGGFLLAAGFWRIAACASRAAGTVVLRHFRAFRCGSALAEAVDAVCAGSAGFLGQRKLAEAAHWPSQKMCLETWMQSLYGWRWLPAAR
jgi:hypothetical protein